MSITEEPTSPGRSRTGLFFAIDPDPGCESVSILWNAPLDYKRLPLNYEPAPAGTCQQCDTPFRPFDVVHLVWLKDAPYKRKRVCSACHEQLTREQKIIREAK